MRRSKSRICPSLRFSMTCFVCVCSASASSLIFFLRLFSLLISASTFLRMASVASSRAPALSDFFTSAGTKASSLTKGCSLSSSLNSFSSSSYRPAKSASLSSSSFRACSLSANRQACASSKGMTCPCQPSCISVSLLSFFLMTMRGSTCRAAARPSV